MFIILVKFTKVNKLYIKTLPNGTMDSNLYFQMRKRSGVSISDTTMRLWKRCEGFTRWNGGYRDRAFSEMLTEKQGVGILGEKREREHGTLYDQKSSARR